MSRRFCSGKAWCEREEFYDHQVPRQGSNSKGKLPQGGTPSPGKLKRCKVCSNYLQNGKCPRCTGPCPICQRPLVNGRCNVCDNLPKENKQVIPNNKPNNKLPNNNNKPNNNNNNKPNNYPGNRITNPNNKSPNNNIPNNNNPNNNNTQNPNIRNPLNDSNPYDNKPNYKQYHIEPDNKYLQKAYQIEQNWNQNLDDSYEIVTYVNTEPHQNFTQQAPVLSITHTGSTHNSNVIQKETYFKHSKRIVENVREQVQQQSCQACLNECSQQSLTVQVPVITMQPIVTAPPPPPLPPVVVQPPPPPVVETVTQVIDEAPEYRIMIEDLKRQVLFLRESMQVKKQKYKGQIDDLLQKLRYQDKEIHDRDVEIDGYKRQITDLNVYIQTLIQKPVEEVKVVERISSPKTHSVPHTSHTVHHVVPVLQQQQQQPVVMQQQPVYQVPVQIQPVQQASIIYETRRNFSPVVRQNVKQVVQSPQKLIQMNSQQLQQQSSTIIQQQPYNIMQKQSIQQPMASYQTIQQPMIQPVQAASRLVQLPNMLQQPAIMQPRIIQFSQQGISNRSDTKEQKQTINNPLKDIKMEGFQNTQSIKINNQIVSKNTDRQYSSQEKQVGIREDTQTLVNPMTETINRQQ